MLRSLNLKPVYDSSKSHLVADLIAPLMESSLEYFRGVGYFSSAWLREASHGVVALVENGGRGRVVLSPILSDQDWEAFRKGGEARADNILHDVLERNIGDLSRALESDLLNALAWLIADDLFDFRFAVPRPQWRGGDYHDKVWVFSDAAGDRVALHGSFNDSIKGTLNGEAVSVFKSWETAQEPYVCAHLARLEDLWNGRNEQFLVRTIPEAAKESLIRLRSSERPYQAPGLTTLGPKTSSTRKPHRPVKLRDFQSKAIDAWMKQGCNGILEMATGTGKTFTSLAAAVKRYETSERLATIILVPYLHLLEQWKRHCERFGFSPILCSGEHGGWRRTLASAVTDFRLGISDNLCILAVHMTAASADFQSRIRPLPAESTLVIGDEVHGLGARQLRKAMMPCAGMHLGLSATPQRWLDDEGTQAIINTFGKVCFEYGLDDAIAGKFLTPYEYYPVLVSLSSRELEEYEALTASIVRLRTSTEANPNLKRTLKHLLIKRAAIIWGAEEKLPALVAMLTGRLETCLSTGERPRHNLVYCAPGEHKVVLKTLAKLGLRCHEFVHTVSMAEREVVLKRFDEGDIEALVAVRCLDEGVDVPATESAYFLASTSNPRQFVQRRGRVLRVAEGKTRAIIVDFLVVPSESPPGDKGVALSLLRREMPRFAEFSLAATNVNAARKVVFDLLDRYEALNMLDETPWKLYEQVLSEQSAFEVDSDPIFMGE